MHMHIICFTLRILVLLRILNFWVYFIDFKIVLKSCDYALYYTLDSSSCCNPDFEPPRCDISGLGLLTRKSLFYTVDIKVSSVPDFLGSCCDTFQLILEKWDVVLSCSLVFSVGVIQI